MKPQRQARFDTATGRSYGSVDTCVSGAATRSGGLLSLCDSLGEKVVDIPAANT